MEEVVEIIRSCSSYGDLQHKLYECADNNLKGFIQEVFAKLYFESHKKQYDVHHYYAHALEAVPEELGVATDDKGTDGVILHKNGEISLVQVKFRSNTYVRLKRDCLGGMSLEAFANKNRVRNLYLFSNTVLPPRNLTSHEKNMLKYVMADVLRDCNWDLIRMQCDGTTAERVLDPPDLLPWQVDALDFVTGFDQTGLTDYEFRRKQIVSACGSGKSVLADAIVFSKDANDEYVYKQSLVIVPNLQLLSQWFDSAATWHPDVNYCLVGSDLDKKETNVPYTISTNVEQIAESLSNAEVCISTYQSIERVIEAARDWLGIEFDLVVCDEAHLCCQSGNRVTCFSRPTEPDFPARNRLFMTATPKIFRGGARETVNDMDNEEIYGERFTYSFREAIEEGVISDYKIIVGVGESSEYGTDVLDFYAKFLLDSVREADINSLLVCSSNHRESKSLYEKVLQYADVMPHELVLMPANANSEQKSTAVHKMRSGAPIIVFNVKVFSIGTNIPNLDAVMITKDKKSVIDSVQTVSRCLRKHETKSHGTILVPCVLSSGELSSGGDFPDLRNFLSAMSSVDGALKEEILLVNKSIRNKTAVTRQRMIVQYISEDATEERCTALSEGYRLQMIDRLGRASVFAPAVRFELLKEYMQESGIVPGNKFIYHDEDIGTFLSRLTADIRIGGWECRSAQQVLELLEIESTHEALMAKINARVKLSAEKSNALKDYIRLNNALPQSGVTHNGSHVGLVLSLLISRSFYNATGDVCMAAIKDEFPAVREELELLMSRKRR